MYLGTASTTETVLQLYLFERLARQHRPSTQVGGFRIESFVAIRKLVGYRKVSRPEAVAFRRAAHALAAN
jgi:hypothetical protein